MRDPAERHRFPLDAQVERLIVLQLLGEENTIARSELRRRLPELDPARLDASIARLAYARVIDATDTHLARGRALAALDRLNMICI